MAKVISGLDVLLGEEIGGLEGKGVGILANHTAITNDFTHITDALHAANVKINALFGPEHGIRGNAAAGASVENSIDSRIGVPVYSLYGKTTEPTPDMLEGIDVMLIDIQDIGARFYTFAYTMANMMRACGKCGVEVWVLDRPNPISGICIEGPLLEDNYASGVGMFAIPIRHGLTSGELARLFRAKFGIECDLHVIKMKNWRREMWFDETGLAWVMPSPNIPTLDSAIVYPGMCLLEGTNVSEGRGTTRPFEIFGAPWIDAAKLRSEMHTYDLPGVAYREAYFTPITSKFTEVPCAGLQLYVTDRKAFKPVLTGIAVICAIRKLHPEHFEFRPAQRGGHAFFDLLVGSSAIRAAIEADTALLDIEKTWMSDLAAYESEAKSIMLY